MNPALNPETVNSIVSGLASTISSIKTELANIDEKYKKLLAEARSSLEAKLEEVNAQYHYWLVERGDLPEDEKKPRKQRAKKTSEEPVYPITEKPVEEAETVEEEKAEKEEEPEVVVDNLFPENNIEDEQPEEETSEEEQPVDEWPVDEAATAEESTEETEQQEQEPGLGDEEWPEFPEEWK